MTSRQVEERDSSAALLLDLATANSDSDATVVTDGLAGPEAKMMPLMGMVAKSQREASFPVEIVENGLEAQTSIANHFGTHNFEPKAFALEVLCF